MLDPCKPCVCPGAPCEQCSFGYQSNEANHRQMRSLLLAVSAGKKPIGWKCAETYKRYHRNWKSEMEDEKYKRGVEMGVIHGFMYTCDRCGKQEFLEGEYSAVMFDKGWRNIGDNTTASILACPECSKEFDDMYKTFISKLNVRKE